MPEERNAGRLVAEVVIESSQAQEEVAYIRDILESVGITGREANKILNECFSDTTELKNYQMQLEEIAIKMQKQKELVYEIEHSKSTRPASKSNLMDMERSSDALNRQKTKLAEMEQEYKNASKAQESFIKKQAKAAQESNKESGYDNINAGIKIFTNSLQAVGQVAPETANNISNIVTQVDSVISIFASGASPVLKFAGLAAGVFNIALSAIAELKKKQQEAQHEAVQLAQAYEKNNKSLRSLSEEYKELKQTLNSMGLSFDEETQAKSQMLSIQEQLVEMYGEEANGLDLVNGKLEEQTDKMKALSVEQSKQYMSAHYGEYQRAVEELDKTKSYTIGGYHLKDETRDTLLGLEEILKPFGVKYYDDFAAGNGRAQNVRDGWMVYKLDLKTEDAQDKLQELFEAIMVYRDLVAETAPQEALDYIDNILTSIGDRIKETSTEDIQEKKTVKSSYESHDKNVKSKEDDSAEKVKDMQREFQQVRNNIGAIQDLTSAYETLSGGQKLSTDSLIDLCDKYPELAAYIEETGDVSFKNGERIADLHKKQREAVISDLEQQKAALEEKETLSNEEIALLKNVEETLAAYKASAVDLQELNLSSVSSELSNLGSVYATLHEGQELDLNTVLQMIDTYPEFAQAIADGSLCLSDQEAVVRSLFETKKEAALKSLELERNDVINKRNTTMETIQLLQQQLEAYKSLYSGMAAGFIMGQLAEAQQEMEGSSEKLNKINAQIAAIKNISIDDYASSSGGAKETASTPVRNEALQQELKLLEHRKSLNQVSAQEEVAWLERINSTYSKNSDDQMDMEKRLYNARKAQQEAEERAAKEALDAALKGIENKKALGKLTTEEEINQLQRIRQTYRMNAEDAMSLEIKLYNLKKNLQNEQTDKLDNIADGVIKALENKYEKQKEYETKRINQSIDSWKKWENETVSAIQGQIDALDELSKAQESEEQRQEYEQKRQATALQLAYEKDDYNRKQLQKELNRLDKEEAKRLEAEAREKQKEELQKQMDKVKEESEKQQEMLKKRQEALNKQYEKLTSSFALEQEAQKIIMQQGMNGVINLINSYAPEFNLAGKSLADKLFEGFKSHNWDIDAYADYIQKGVSAAYAKAAGTAAKAADEFWKSRIEYDRQTGMTTAQVKAPKIDLTVNFNQPVESPIETQRRLQNVARELARQIIK